MIFPSQPVFTVISHQFPLFNTTTLVFFPFTLVVLMNAGVFALVVPISLLIRNLYSLGLEEFAKNATICFVATRVNINGLGANKFTRLAHTYQETDGHLIRKYSLGGVAIDGDLLKRLQVYHREDKVENEVWVTPELPFILFITLGFIVACLVEL